MKDDFVFPRTGIGAPGMELRDWFAGIAMQAMVTKYGTDVPILDVAVAANCLSDCMMQLRGKKIEEMIDIINSVEESEQNND